MRFLGLCQGKLIGLEVCESGVDGGPIRVSVPDHWRAESRISAASAVREGGLDQLRGDMNSSIHIMKGCKIWPACAMLALWHRLQYQYSFQISALIWQFK